MMSRIEFDTDDGISITTSEDDRQLFKCRYYKHRYNCRRNELCWMICIIIVLEYCIPTMQTILSFQCYRSRNRNRRMLVFVKQQRQVLKQSHINTYCRNNSCNHNLRVVCFAQSDDTNANDNDNESSNSNNNSNNSNNDDSFLSWLSSSSSSSPSSSSSKQPSQDTPKMVQPIGMDGKPIQPQSFMSQSTKSTTAAAAAATNRIRPNFGNLFQGMPGLNDIIGGSSDSGSNDENLLSVTNEDDDDDDDDDEVDTTSTYGKNPMGRPKRRRYTEKKEKLDETWFDSEKKQIMSKYESILKDMTEQITTERKVDPESVPNNAEELMKSILKQEMELEIQSTKSERIQEQYISYQDNKRIQQIDIDHDNDSNNNDIDTSQKTGITNPNIQRLMDESEAQYVQQSKTQNELQNYLQYEASRKQQEQQQQMSTIPSDPNDSSSVQLPKPNENLDSWALESLKRMINSRNGQEEDVDEMILDILQDNVNQLENDIRKESDKRMQSKFTDTQQQPQTMKEWQMYRSIASRINKESTIQDDGLDSDNRDELIMEQLRLWKEYTNKEEINRIQSGLARGPKLPFPWQESVYDQQTTDNSGNNNNKNSDKASRIEVRKQLNRMSIEAMESLLLNTNDTTRRNKLQKEIDYLKSILEVNDYLDIDESVFDNNNNNNTGTSLSSSLEMNGPLNTTDLFTSPSQNKDIYYGWDTSSSSSSSLSSTSTTTPFVSRTQLSSVDEVDDLNQPTNRPPPPPKTAFFADLEEEYDMGETLTGDSKLGNYEEQKMEAMFRRAGVKTAEERNYIKSQYEEFKELEKIKRLESGLTGGIDIDAVNTSTGNEINYIQDGNLETLFAKRPVRTKKNVVESSTDSDKTQEKIIDSLFRSVSAVGGGRYKDDPVTKQRERSSFEEFVMKESRMRESLDDPGRPTLNDLHLPDPMDDDVKYAEEVLSSIGSRPKSKRAKAVDVREYSDRGGVLASDNIFDDDDDEEEDDNDEEDKDENNPSMSAESDTIPEWLKKENEEVMTKTGVPLIDEVFDNDKYEHNMRQLAEYEKRRAGRSRSMGIDISDVLGRRDSDDYADFKFDDDSLRSRQSDSWRDGSFKARKDNLLDYIELDVREINALMDHKDSVYSTGVSQYLARINKPFKDFGAIFRLEGVILNVNGLQRDAWVKVANEYGYKKPTIDDVRLAAVTRPETAVKDIFAWSDDFLECRKIAASHRRTFRTVFASWASSNGINVSETPLASAARQFAFVNESRQDVSKIDEARPSLNESDMLKQTAAAWKSTATEFMKPPPDDTAVLIASTLSADIAILKVFKWSSDPLEIERIARSYYLHLLPDKERQATIALSANTNKAIKSKQTQTEMMELHYKAWSDVAKTYGYNVPAPDEVLAAFVINEPEIAARGFGWSDNSQELLNIAKDFRLKLDEFQSSSATAESRPSLMSDQSITIDTRTENTNREDLFKIAYDAWSETARVNGYQAPDVDQVQFALSVGAEEAIIYGFQWSTNPTEIAKLLRSYRDALGKIRGTEFKAKTVDTTIEPDKSTSGPSPDDVYCTAFDSWTAIAKECGYPLPDDEQVQFALSVGAEEAITHGFGWSNESSKVAEILSRYKAEIAKRRSKWQNAISTTSKSISEMDEIPMFKVTPGVSKWIKSLIDVEMQCAVISYLDRDQVDVLLELAGVSDLISVENRVSATNGYVTDTDMLLGASLRVERRPDHCVVFDTTPYSSLAAHEVEMQSVCLIGPYPRYELLSADTTAASFDSLSAINIRRLFGERVYDQPLLDVQTTDPGTVRRTKTRTRFFEDD